MRIARRGKTFGVDLMNRISQLEDDTFYINVPAALTTRYRSSRYAPIRPITSWERPGAVVIAHPEGSRPPVTI